MYIYLYVYHHIWAYAGLSITQVMSSTHSHYVKTRILLAQMGRQLDYCRASIAPCFAVVLSRLHYVLCTTSTPNFHECLSFVYAVAKNEHELHSLTLLNKVMRIGSFLVARS